MKMETQNKNPIKDSTIGANVSEAAASLKLEAGTRRPTKRTYIQQPRHFWVYTQAPTPDGQIHNGLDACPTRQPWKRPQI
jgi:hypothetical protein